MVEKEGEKRVPLAAVEDPEELKQRYRPVSSSVLRRWMDAVIGPHHDAMAAILAEREAAGEDAVQD